MGRKSTGKKDGPKPAAPARAPEKGINPLVWVVAAVVVVGGAALAMRPATNTAGTDSATGAEADAQRPVAVATAEGVARAEANAAFGPHTQDTLPPVPFQAYTPPRSPEVITAAYEFAAEHPEVLSYVPCFCGCEQSGHDGNHSCFVKSRAANGDVVEWDQHGVDCAVCIDVATRSRQLHASGASVGDIRAAVEGEFGPLSPRITPTPDPPGAHPH